MSASLNEPAANEAPELVLSPMTVGTLRPFDFFCVEGITTMPEMFPVIADLVARIDRLKKESGVSIAASLILRYVCGPGDQLVIQAGYPVEDGSSPYGEAKILRIEGFHSASMIYQGNIRRIGEAYVLIQREMEKRGLKMSDEFWERYHYWESEDSPNNVTQVMQGAEIDET